MNNEIFVEVPLTGCIEGAPEGLSVRLQCTDINIGGLGFVFDLLENGVTVLSTGMRAMHGMFIAFYLLKVTGRTPGFSIDQLAAGAWSTKIKATLYSFEGETNGTAELWVEDNAIWVGYGYAGQLISRARLDASNLAGLARLADAMDAAFWADK